MPNDKSASLNRDDIADAIDTKVEIPMAQAKTDTTIASEKADPAAKNPRRKLGQRAGGSRG